MAVSSFYATTDADFNAPESHTSHFNKLQELCEKYEANGIMATVSSTAIQLSFLLCPIFSHSALLLFEGKLIIESV